MRRFNVAARGAVLAAIVTGALVAAPAYAEIDPAVVSAVNTLNAGCGATGGDCVATVAAVLAGLASVSPEAQIAITSNIGAIAAVNPTLKAQIEALVDTTATSLGLPALSETFDVSAATGVPSVQVPTISGSAA